MVFHKCATSMMFFLAMFAKSLIRFMKKFFFELNFAKTLLNSG